MAGRPKFRACKSAVERMGGIDAVCELIASGRTISSIARDIGFSRAMLSDVLHSRPDWSEKVKAAQRRAAGAWAEQALELADAATPEDYRVRELQVDVRKWLSGVCDPDRYARRPEQQVSVSIGQVHVAVLQAVERLARQAVSAPADPATAVLEASRGSAAENRITARALIPDAAVQIPAGEEKAKTTSRQIPAGEEKAKTTSSEVAAAQSGGLTASLEAVKPL